MISGALSHVGGWSATLPNRAVGKALRVEIDDDTFIPLRGQLHWIKRASVEKEVRVSIPDVYANFRGGAIYAAANVAPTTARTWALLLGKARQGGHPRYNLTDAVVLNLMKVLTLEGGLPPKRAAAILNDNRGALESVVQAICAEHSAAGRLRWNGGPYLHIQVASSDMYMQSDTVRILSDQEIGSAVADSGNLQIIARLPHHVCKMKVSLDNVMRGDVSFETVD